ncbi:MAG: metal ABC transporter permease [Lachnospiraceae bacterium]|nr:metal ABC transporter permease [Lachnospiraceae bacterium]MDE6625007.1 metal ABC transporter permease [Lachnospiraceae bacterium]
MLDIFQYVFMQKAFLVGILLAVIIPLIGVIVVLKRLSMIGDALSHTSLAGVALGLLLGFNPIIGAVVVCVIAAFSIEAIRRRLPKYAEISISIIMSVGIGLASVLSGFIEDGAAFNSFLFGSIVAITDTEVALVIAVTAIVVVTFLLLYKELMFITFDEQGAILAGIPVKKINFVITILTAITVSVAARSVGALMVSSLMVIPVACAMQLANSYKKTVIYSVLFALLFTVAGLFLSYYFNLKPGGTIVLTGVVVLIPLMISKKR